MKTCKQCQSQFEITKQDQGFYEKIKVPEPKLCPTCRQQRRLAFRNERYLYRRNCDLCKNSVVVAFDTDVSFPVYCKKCWWSDEWDPLIYGRDFDTNRPFFEQFQELMMKVPKMGMLQLENENSEYTNLLAYSKNTYMSPGSYYLEDCYYVRKSQYCKDCLDSNSIDHCELLHSSINCNNCYQSYYLMNCKNCSDCKYLADCIGCNNCFMCSGISNKKYHFKNKSYSKEEYEKIVREQMQRDPEELLNEFLKFNKTIPKKYQNQINCENSSGDYIQNCKNAIECYDCYDVEDAKYLVESVGVKDSMDLSMHDKDIELCYELSSGGESNVNLKFSFCSCACPDSEYLFTCMYLSDSFGCDGIHGKQKNCILNKQYSPEEYTKLKEKIIQHMMKTGEYGEFFPIQMSPYPYNETNAQEFHPISKETAKKNGWKWRDESEKQYQPATAQLTADIKEIPDNIIDELLACKCTKCETHKGEKCGKNYKVISQELDLCRQMNLPLSKHCPECRSLNLIALKNPRKLWDRKCDKCSAPIQTTYAPDRPETVYCEKCYQDSRG